VKEFKQEHIKHLCFCAKCNQRIYPSDVRTGISLTGNFEDQSFYIVTVSCHGKSERKAICAFSLNKAYETRNSERIMDLLTFFRRDVIMDEHLKERIASIDDIL